MQQHQDIENQNFEESKILEVKLDLSKLRLEDFYSSITTNPMFSGMLKNEDFTGKSNFFVVPFTENNYHSSEVKHYEQQRICKICYDKESLKNPLISPCLCTGSMKYIHELCLKSWIKSKKVILENAACEICKEKYKMKIEMKECFTLSKCATFTCKFLAIMFFITLFCAAIGLLIMKIILG